jgi:hypothetical protein
MGALAAWLLGRSGNRSLLRAIGVALLSLTLCGGALLLLALEGVLCLTMAAPLAYLLGTMGAVVGHAFTRGVGPADPSMAAMVVGLPILGVAETTAPQQLRVYEVTSEILIDAPPGQVWPNVIGFSELPPPEDWLLKTGVACPVRARIEGEGVGAIRHCEFTTGAFVEPITVWDPPHRLGFDVVEQPPSMAEWSPWSVVHAPHIEGSMVSQRGQFDLEALDDGRTLLKGTTWYTLDIAPQHYWTLYSDAIVHRIHTRVLDHVRDLSESSGTTL